METPRANSRRHDLDALRAFAMLLGIALHAALSFTGGPWMVQDTRTSGLFHLMVGAVHGFRMPLFFLLSGFFTAMLWRKRGLRALLAHRFKRVFLPLVLGSVTIVPVMFLLGGVSAKSGARQEESKPATLWHACAAGDEDLVRGFLGDGADVNAPDPLLGATPLTHASLFGRENVARLLLERGADANKTNRDGGTALHAAAFLGRAGIVRMLLGAGADPRVRNERGDTALDAARTDLRATQFLARILRVNVEMDALQAGRAETRRLLGGDASEEKPRPLLGVWLFLRHMPVFAHLWFLWFLCWMFAGFAMCARLADGIGWRPAPRARVTSAWRYLWLVPLTLIPSWLMAQAGQNFGPETSSSILPPAHLLAYYAVFFGFGALWHDSMDTAGRLGRCWWLTLPLALLLVYPAGLAATLGGAKLRGAAVLLQVLYAWLMCVAMIGLFRRFVSGERGWVRYLSDASYWMYLAHLPLVVAAQMWARDWPLPAGMKFLLVCAGVFALLLASYRWLVRHTWIGALLNGRKERPPMSQPAVTGSP
ncbi:MAG TPA: hypothetical protein DIT13_02295 [Verrucomicrobiales bacterium]|nr:hypothetical protein [Verrucomicrobiales bacterium]HRJ09509.1 acyltransferase family protein [Prosthecobacter sp.]HRK15010.1 acyltransferase family protein [Prosthecobacter sp.]